MKARVKTGVTAVVVAISAFAPYFPELGKQFVQDWNYFNALSLVVRSIVWEYQRFPLHNPFVCGGLDLLTNPQNRIFSPLMLADLLLRPQWANVAGLMAYAAVGFIGARLLFIQLGVSTLVATVGAILFLHGNWFGFHYTEGHIPFGSMQLLPWMAYLAMRCGSRRHLIAMGFTVSVMLLDGGMYAFIFSILTVVTMLAIGFIPRAELKAVFSRPLELAAVLFATALLATPKMLPVLIAMRNRGPDMDFTTMSPELLEKALFWPFVGFFEQPTESAWRFHEFACYVSPLGLAIALIGGTRPLQYWKRALPLLLAGLFWLWVGSGYWPDWNPWRAFQRIPLINNAHVQSRVLLIMFMFFVILVTLALERLRERHWVAFAIPALLLVAEAVVVHRHPMLEVVRRDPERRAPVKLVRSRQINYTAPSSYHTIPQHYYERASSAECYEPSFRPPATLIRHIEEGAYCGEACLVDRNAGWAQITRHSPGRITLEYDLRKPTTIDLNTHALFGWRVRETGAATLHGQAYERLQVEPAALRGKLRLYYRPAYLPWVFASLVAGIALFAALWIRSRPTAGPPPT